MIALVMDALLDTIYIIYFACQQTRTDNYLSLTSPLTRLDPMVPPLLHHIIRRTPIPTRMQRPYPIRLKILRCKISRFQRQIRRAKRRLAEVVEAVVNVPKVDRVANGEVEHAEAVELVENGHHEVAVGGAEVSVPPACRG